MERIGVFMLFTLFTSFAHMKQVVSLNYEKRLVQYDFHLNEYLLLTTSTKIFCIKANAKQTLNYEHANIVNGNLQLIPKTNSSQDGLEIIYEELYSPSSWITDVYYDRVDNIIYANIYNGNTFKSDIISLKYDKPSGLWIKTILFAEQNNCLGITYNEIFKELYWTSGQTVMAGLLAITSKPTRVLFNLNTTKKLLYLKYDRQNEAIYVSTPTDIYVCFQSKVQMYNCKVLLSGFNSARGLHFDAASSYLYAADHKKKSIRRVFVGDALQDMFNNKTWNIDSYTTVIDSTSSIGDIFYLCLHKSTLLWTEFSGKLKATNLNSMMNANYETLFTTNEYLYAVSVMDNSTYEMSYDTDGLEKSDAVDYADIDTVLLGVQQTETTGSTTTTTTTTTMSPSTTSKTGTSFAIDEVTELVDDVDLVSQVASRPPISIFNALQYDHGADLNTRAELNSANNIQINLNKQKVSNQNITSNRLIDVSDGTNSINLKSPFMITLYAISALFGLSLIVNLILLYVTKLRNKRATNCDADPSEKQNLRNELTTDLV